MATATQKERAARQVARRAKASAVLTFAVFEDNGGDYRWTILDGSGESLAQSGPFASYGDASTAARVVHDRAGTARSGDWPDENGRGGEAAGR